MSLEARMPLVSMQSVQNKFCTNSKKKTNKIRKELPIQWMPKTESKISSARFHLRIIFSVLGTEPGNWFLSLAGDICVIYYVST